MNRPIIQIDEEKCNGCGKCITDCAEGALAIVDGKARLISDSYCDGLGACLQCPQNALTLVHREAPPFDEAAALAAKKAREKSSGLKPLGLKTLGPDREMLKGELPSWPVQLALLPNNTKFPADSDFLLAAHCSAFALPQFHEKILKGGIPVIACPKLQDARMLAEKLASLLAANRAKSLTVCRMSVPCCSGLEKMAEKALATLDYKPAYNVEIIKA